MVLLSVGIDGWLAYHLHGGASHNDGSHDSQVDFWDQKCHPRVVSNSDPAELGDLIGASSGSTQRLTLYVPTRIAMANQSLTDWIGFKG